MVLLFVEPTSPREAVALLNKHGPESKLLAGGTAVVLQMQQRILRPVALISLAHVAGLQGIALGEAGALHIGTMVSLAQAAADTRVRQGWPLLARACGVAANVRLRYQATLGGNIAEAIPTSDPPAALLALDAAVRVLGPGGQRQIRLADFWLGRSTTALARDELLTEIIVPPPPMAMSSIYTKYLSRASEDRSCVNVAVALAVQGEHCTAVRVAVGAACAVPQRFEALERALVGQRLTPAILADFASTYAEALHEPLDDLRGSAWYRRRMAAVHIRRSLVALAGLEVSS
jgi:carbon-monoxide dehydrogenase medium subunit